MNPSLLMLLTFASVALGILGAGVVLMDLFLRNRNRIDQRMKAEFRDAAAQHARQSPLFRDLRSIAGAAAQSPTLRIRLQTVIEQAGLIWKVERVLAWSAVLALFVSAATRLISGGWLAAIPAALAGFLVPAAYIHLARKKRITKLCRQLPEAFEVMGRSLRAGQTVQSAFQVVVNDFPQPIKEEFAYCYEQQHLGVPYSVALRDLARRTGLIETQIFAVAMIVNRQVGGNFAELLGTLATTMRKRARFHGRVRALTGEGRMQAAVLIALPVLALGALCILDRSYAQVLFDRPMILLCTVVSQLIGAACIHKIINFKF